MKNQLKVKLNKAAGLVPAVFSVSPERFEAIMIAGQFNMGGIDTTEEVWQFAEQASKHCKIPNELAALFFNLGVTCEQDRLSSRVMFSMPPAQA